MTDSAPENPAPTVTPKSSIAKENPDSNGSSSHPGDNKFQQAISAWRSGCSAESPQIKALMNGFLDIDLTSLVTTLDNTASEIVTYQRDSTVQRKDLAQKTKDFRKLEDSAKLVEIKGLLKGT